MARRWAYDGGTFCTARRRKAHTVLGKPCGPLTFLNNSLRTARTMEFYVQASRARHARNK